MTHALKTWPEYFEQVFQGNKTFELRKNDREFKVGDTLALQEWDNYFGAYTGRCIDVDVTYILSGGNFGIEKGYVVMGIKRVNIFQRLFR